MNHTSTTAPNAPAIPALQPLNPPVSSARTVLAMNKLKGWLELKNPTIKNSRTPNLSIFRPDMVRSSHVLRSPFSMNADFTCASDASESFRP